MSTFFQIDPTDADDPLLGPLSDPLSNFEPVQYCNELERALSEETVEDMEVTPVLKIGPDVSVHDAIAKLHQFGVSSLLVVQDERLVGIFTERDVLEKIAERYPRICDLPVREFMTSDPTVVYHSDPIAAAAAAIAIAGHRHVPVLDLNEHVRGVISPRRVFEFMQQHF